MFHHKKIIWIEHIFVDPERRREGIALSMINFMISYYLKNNSDIKKVIGKINAENEASLKMSRKFFPEYQTTILVTINIDKGSV